MSNIRTLKDLEKGNDGPNRQPLENPWNNPKKYDKSSSSSNNSGRATGYQSSYEYQQPMISNQQQYLPYIGVDGYQKVLPPDEMTPSNLCCSQCFPCLVTPLCGADRKSEYVNALKSFMVPLFIVQLILLIASLCIDGFAPASVNPMLGPPVSSLITMGAKVDYYMRYNYAVWRFFTPMFLHSGILHLLFNGLAELRFCLYIERDWGIIKTMVIYFIGGVGSTLFSALIEVDTVSVGASGAILAVIGAYCTQLISNYFNHKLDRRQRNSSLIQVVFIVFTAFLISLGPYVDWSGHLGGMIVGFLLGGAILHESNRIRIPSTVLLVCYFILGTALFYTVLKV